MRNFYSIRCINWNKKIKIKIIFFCWHFDFDVHFKRRGQENFFCPSKKCFLFLPIQNIYKKIIDSSFKLTKNILVFSFSFWFQFIQGIERIFLSFQTGKKSSLHTWQLKTIGVEAEVLLSKATIWSKHSSSGAWSWLTGILRASTLETLKEKHFEKKIIH